MVNAKPTVTVIQTETREEWRRIDARLAGLVIAYRDDGETNRAAACDRVRRAIRVAARRPAAGDAEFAALCRQLLAIGVGEPVDRRSLGVELYPDDAALFARLFPVDIDEREKIANYERELDRFRRTTRRTGKSGKRKIKTESR